MPNGAQRYSLGMIEEKRGERKRERERERERS